MQEDESKSKKVLLYSEKYFQGYWVQLQSRIRRNDDADDILEGYLENPLATLRRAWDKHHDNPLPAGDQVNDLYNTGNSVSAEYNYCTCLLTLYTGTTYGEPHGNFPPTMAQLERDPMKHIKDFVLATERGTTGGQNKQGRSDNATKAWVKTAFEDVLRYRRACKFIWDTALATLTSEKATTIIAGLPYGSGPTLLRQIRSQQQRQTTMALYTLFSQLISLRLNSGENFASMYARALGIRARLANWQPPIELPDQLIIVCILRLLPGMYHGTRTIIMSTANVTLKTARDMLLDCENRDAERVAQQLGSRTPKAQPGPNTGTGLLGDEGDGSRRRRKKKKKKPAEKSAKYLAEGPCSVHGSRCSHASSECYVLHPELKPKPKGEAAVAAAEPEVEEETMPEMGGFGFMNESTGFALMMTGAHTSNDEKEVADNDVELDEEKECDAEADVVKDAEYEEIPVADASPAPTGRKRKYYAVAVGHQVGIFVDWETARKACQGYPGCKYKSFKTEREAQKFIQENQEPTATYHGADGSSKSGKVPHKPNRKRPKNYHWSKRGTKASRRKEKEMAKSNVIHADMVQVNKGSAKKQPVQGSIKQMARSGGLKDLSKADVVDLTNLAAEATEALASVISAARADDEAIRRREDLAEVEVIELGSETPEEVEDLTGGGEASAGADKSDVIKNAAGEVTVKSTYINGAGTKTTMVYAEKIPRYMLSDRVKSAEVDARTVKLELLLNVDDLRKVEPGSTIRLKVDTIVKPDSVGAALIADVQDELYEFLGYDGDDEYDEDCDEDLLYAAADSSREGTRRSAEAVPKVCNGPDESGQWESHSHAYDSDEPPPLLRQSSSSSSESEESSDESTVEEACGKCARDAGHRSDDSDSEGPPKLTEVSLGSSESDWSDDSDSEAPPRTASDSGSTGYEKRHDCGAAYVQTNKKEAGTALDSGATEHCARHVNGTLSAPTISSISGLSGETREVKGMNAVKVVKNVMHIPGISRNLLSVGRLLDQFGGQVSFTRSEARLISKKVQALVARREGTGLYIVCNEKYDLCGHGEAHAATPISVEVAKKRIVALHRAYAHASRSTMQKILANRKFDGLSAKHLDLMPPCEPCLMGKAHKASRHKVGSEKATAFGERVCADCTGPFRTKSLSGCAYLLVVVDEYSAWTWATPMRSLDEVHTHLTTLFEVNLHQRDDSAVKFFRTDGGTEFTNQKVSALLAKLGIVRETTCAKTSYQNGKAERRIRTVFDRVRTTLSDAGANLSTGFWAEAAVYAVYTLNRTPSEDCGKTPFELRYNKAPKISHLRPFGNPCVVYRERSVAGKLKPAGIKGIFLGYGYVDGKRGYRVRIVGTNKVVTTKNVAFCAYEVQPAEVEALVDDDTRPADAVITTPANAVEIDARINLPVNPVESTDEQRHEGRPTITEPVNAAEYEAAIDRKVATRGAHTYTPGAKVVANWRGHGVYYPAVVTGVYPAGANGSRTTYDLVYETDGEAESKVSGKDIRPRGDADRENSSPCGHALVTDCHPAYLADVPDLARAHVTPKHYGHATRGPDKVHWTKSMQEELESLRKQGVYIFVDSLPTGEVALRCLWVYKVKCGPDGEVTRYKSRLTVNGKSQRYGIDYTKTFSPVAFATSIRLLFALGLTSDFTFRQYDIKCAFLYADLPKEQQVYMYSPPGAERKGYWLLKKSLYGLRQAPMLFNGHLDSTLQKLGFVSCTFDPCLYFHSKSGSYLVVVVDDMVLGCPDEQFAKTFYTNLKKHYDVKDLGVPEYVIGVRVTVKENSVSFAQDRYISDLVNLHKPGETPTNTPAVPGDTLCSTGIHKQHASPLLKDATKYRSLVGGLMYTLITRPDVAAAVSSCARYVQKPTEAHLAAANRILRFLNHTKTKPLVYYKCKGIVVTAFVDSSWANCPDTRRSRFGYAIYLGRCLIAWCSKLHPAVALSSAEAEYTAATEAAKTIKWIVSLMSFLQRKPPTPIRVFEDNAACRIMVKSQQVSGRNKHFEHRQHYVRQQVQLGLISLLEVGTANQIADIFTKPTARPAFENHARALLEGLPKEFS